MADQKIAVVTGSTSGLGEYIAYGMARAGYHVVLVARDAGRAAATQGWIASKARGASTEVVLADLSSLAQVRAAGEAITAAHPRIDVLVNNAGMVTGHRQETVDGHEATLAVNHLAPFVLTGVLEGALRAGPLARVVDVGSTASDRASLDLADLELRQGWGPMRAYCRAKLALLMAGFERAKRLEASGVSVNVCHPGVVATRWGRDFRAVRMGLQLIRPLLLSPEQGADTALYLALSPLVQGQTGLYWKRRKPARPNKLARDPALRRQLWRATEQLIG